MERADDARPAARVNASHAADARGHTPNLSRERIIRSAIDLLDAEGLAGLSMRRLADQLDAGAMSLYWYFSTKDELLRATTDAVLGEIRLQDLPEDWRATVRAISLDLRATIHRHRWLRQMLSSVPASGQHGLTVMERILGTLAQAGLSGHQIDIAMSTIFGYVLGFAVAENIWAELVQTARAGDQPELSETVAASYPHFAQFMAGTTTIEPNARFLTGINLILAGIEAEMPS